MTGFALGDRDVLLAMSTLEGLLPNDLYDKVYTVTGPSASHAAWSSPCV